MKTKLIVNPASGNETALGHLPAINARLREAGDVDIVLTTGEGDGVELGRRAALEGCDRVFVAGGDGTLNEVLNGVAEVDGALARMPIGVVPLGTGNDFATAIGVPDAPHLHFAIFRLGPERRWWEGRPIDPYPVLAALRAGSTH